MAQVIAGIYEIEERIGAGGGGVVYRGRHTRLNKKIALKADKRQLRVGTEALRREVDLLKGLNQTYIPQVYDFIQEDGSVYTIMDYVEGESLDKLLRRGQAISQRDVVKWACQLLEALSYLHNQEPNGILHGDIKPANIMLRPDGDICLIDFNIALALGEDGAVKVGFSRGYASPEHYGSEGAMENPLSLAQGKENPLTAQSGSGREGRGATEYEAPNTVCGARSPMADIAYGNGGHRQDGGYRGEGQEKGEEKTVAGGGQESQPSSSWKKTVLLDVRSDLYSLGATLHHLLSGRKPAERAAEVAPLSGCCSPEVSAIVQKAMCPDPEGRYQSAEEMLDAFLRLRERDSRVIKNKRRFAFSGAASVALFLMGGAFAFIGMKQAENYQAALTLASYAEASLADGDIPMARRQAMEALDTGEGIWKAPVPAEAKKALADALGVYDLSDGFKAEDIIPLPAAPFDLTVSPEGSRYAVVYAYEAAVYSIGEREPTAVRKVCKSAFSDCLFLDEDTILYAGEQGVEAYDLESGQVLWVGEEASALALSGDRKVAAAVSLEDDFAILYHTADGAKLGECSFAGRHVKELANEAHADFGDYIFSLDSAGAWLAVSFSNGGLSIFDTEDQENELILYDESDYDVFSGGFCGELFAYAAQGPKLNFFGVVDTKEAQMVGSWESRDKLLVQADEKGICLSDGNLLVRFAAGTLEESELAYTEGNTIEGFYVGNEFSMVVTDDNRVSFFDRGAGFNSQAAYEERSAFVKLADGYALVASREEPAVRVLCLEGHEDAELLSYDASYPHNEARISGDGEAAMLFSYKGFQIYGSNGELIAQSQLPDAENIYDQQYIRDGDASYLEVIWYDGTARKYGMDGAVLGEEKRGAPDKSLEEEFLTDKYRIVSRLHETPQVYSREGGDLVGELEKDAELTYVTQLDGYIMTEYVSADLERYGILLDEDLQKLAYLPDLCDVYGDTVVFDYQNGHLRSCSIYSLEELVALGSRYK